LETLVSYGLPPMLVVGMIGVGLSIQRPAVEELIGQPGAIATATLLQAVLLPIVVMVTLVVVRPAAQVATMLLLLSACPGGGISNLFTLIARANTALSVAMTLASLTAATVTVALVLHVLRALGMPTGSIGGAPLGLITRIAVMMLVPAAVGAAIRWRAPVVAERAVPVFRQVALCLIAVIVGIVFWLEAGAIGHIAFGMAVSAVVFVTLAVGVGSVVGRCLFAKQEDRDATMLEFGVRNVAVASTLAVGITGNVVLAGAATIFFIVETALCATIAFVIGRRRPG
jgi:BASS family bile acid:Na+ symporter